MAFSSGTYTLPGAALNTGDTVSATENNTLRNDMATAFNKTWLRDGTAAATANIPLGGFKLTGLAAATTAGDAVRYEQLPSSTNIVAEASGGTGTTTGYYGFKNRIINGAMAIDQRNAGNIVATTSANATIYTLDRWAYGVTQASKFTVQQTPSVTETGYATRVGAGFTNYLACTSTSAYSILSGDAFSIRQIIEGNNISDLAWGTANAKTVTLSFWVYSSLTGTFGGSVFNGSVNRCYPFSYTISAANTWTQISITISGDTSGTWATNNTAGIYLSFSLGTGSTLSGTGGSWGSTFYNSVTGATSVVGTSGATFYITGVQLEKGSTATSFDYRPYGTELALCQRYCLIISGVNYPIGVGLAYGTTTANCVIPFPATMRSAPSPTYSGVTDFVATNGSGSGINSTTVANYVASPNSFEFTITVASGLTIGQASLMRTGGGGTAKITLSSEL